MKHWLSFKGLSTWFLVLVLRTWILIHVLDLDLSLVLGTFFVLVLFLIRSPRHSPRIYGTSYAPNNPVSKASCIPSDTVLT